MFSYGFEWVNYHHEINCHCHPPSEQYSGGDQLLTALRLGWELDNLAFRMFYELRGMRRVTAYGVILRHRGKRMTMLIVDNPFVTKLINASELRIVTLRQPIPIRRSVLRRPDRLTGQRLIRADDDPTVSVQEVNSALS
ncbi:MAG: hypothetical protein ACOCX5_01200 [Chloroflexota bacterium]